MWYARVKASCPDLTSSPTPTWPTLSPTCAPSSKGSIRHPSALLSCESSRLVGVGAWQPGGGARGQSPPQEETGKQDQHRITHHEHRNRHALEIHQVIVVRWENVLARRACYRQQCPRPPPRSNRDQRHERHEPDKELRRQHPAADQEHDQRQAPPYRHI